MCAQVSLAVRELSKSHSDRVRFRIVLRKGDAVKKEIEGFDIGTHGLIALDADDNPVDKIPGHDFAAPEIEARIRNLLEN